MADLQIPIDLRSKVPAYVQIVDQVRGLVASGALRPGDQLPTVRQLAADLRINFNTVARAYRMLDESGVISTQQGRGTYVVESPPPARARKLRATALENLGRDFLTGAARLGFSPNEVRAMIDEALRRWEAEAKQGD
ncbi:MAG TPA: GntR family transcriptional regulator [Anaerolineales bacterium]|nr:GntR family transcriptional regulator [Anaerolineales bacterium]